MDDYVNKFEELGSYYSNARHIPNESWKINHFRWGLRADIQHSVSSQDYTSLAALVHRCHIAEDGMKRMQEER